MNKRQEVKKALNLINWALAFRGINVLCFLIAATLFVFGLLAETLNSCVCLHLASVCLIFASDRALRISRRLSKESRAIYENSKGMIE